MTPRAAAWIVGVMLVGVAAGTAGAQDPVTPPPGDEDAALVRRRGTTITPRVSGLAGVQTFSAAESFDAILGTSSGIVYGGSAGVLIGRHVFVDVQVSRFRADGSRVFISEQGERFDLGFWQVPPGIDVAPTRQGLARDPVFGRPARIVGMVGIAAFVLQDLGKATAPA